MPPPSVLIAAKTGDPQIILQRLSRRKKTASAATLILFTGMIAGILSLTPRYSAKGTVIIVERETKVVAFQQVMSAMPADNEIA
jgi:uncharacterized protein involved in exopolysaccharide biosynthesis